MGGRGLRFVLGVEGGPPYPPPITCSHRAVGQRRGGGALWLGRAVTRGGGRLGTTVAGLGRVPVASRP